MANFASSQALLHDAEEHNTGILETTFYEVTIASVDQQKLLSRLSEALVSQRQADYL